MSLAHPGPGPCDVCGERVPARHPFLIQVKNARVLTNVVGAHCEACDRHFQVFRARRLQAIAMLVLAAMLFAPVLGLASGAGGAAGPVIAFLVVAAPVALAFWRVAMWHDALRDAIGAELLDDLARALPDAPGTLGWSEVRFFPSVPRVPLHHALEDLRRRAERTRRLPN